MLLGIPLLFLISGHSGKRGPFYGGRPADEWFADMMTTNKPAALDAFSEMGTNALPYLIQKFRLRDTILDKAWQSTYPNLPAPLRQRLPQPYSAEHQWSVASYALTSHPDGDKAIPELLQILADKKLHSHAYVLPILWKWADLPHADWVPTMIQCLQEPDASARECAAIVLGQMGSQAKATIPALNKALQDTNEAVRVEAAWSLWRINGATNGVAVLMQACHSSSLTGEERNALFLLSQLGWKDPALIPIYSTWVTSSDQQLSVACASALEKFGPAAKEAIPALVQKYQINPKYDREYIVKALAAIDREAAAKCEQK